MVLILVLQDYFLQPAELCKDHGLPSPISLSVTSPDLLSQTYFNLARIARDP